MAISKYANNLLKWLVRYNITVEQLVSRIPITRQRGNIIKFSLSELLDTEVNFTIAMIDNGIEGDISTGFESYEFLNSSNEILLSGDFILNETYVEITTTSLILGDIVKVKLIPKNDNYIIYNIQYNLVIDEGNVITNNYSQIEPQSIINIPLSSLFLGMLIEFTSSEFISI